MAKNNIVHQKYSLSPKLKKIIDIETDIPISEIVKKVWEYIKENNLQDPENKRYILSDEKMLKIFPERFLGFSMMKYLKSYIEKVEE
jgi:upstream activation factor subunit UAF30